MRDVYFGDLEPIVQEMEWDGHPYEVAYRLLDGGQEAVLAMRVSQFPPPVRLQMERRLRLAWSIVSVNGREVTFGGETDADELRLREEWAQGWDGPKLFMLSAYYEEAAKVPIAALIKMIEDETFGHGPSIPGGWSDLDRSQDT